VTQKKRALSIQKLTKFLRQHTKEIVRQCAQAIAMDPGVPASFALGNPDPAESLDTVLGCIIAHIERSCETDPMNLESAPHVETRFKQGYSLFSLIRELHHLRRTIIALLQAKKIQLEDSATHALHDAIDECMSLEAEAMSQKEATLRELFVAALGHDLRTPLMVIIGSGTKLLAHASLAAGHVHTLQRLLRSAYRTQRMIEDLLTLSKARQGAGLTLTRVPTSLLEICSVVIQEIEVAYPETTVELIGRERDTHGNWDKELLCRASMNLVTNAIQHGDRTKPVQLLLDVDNGTAILNVRNAGPQIAAETFDMIFEPFYRGCADCDTPPESRRGLGLGLWIVRKIVQAHQGTVTVRSTAEEGTTFTVRLPRQPP
jgi:signal transduction histidine kinase